MDGKALVLLAGGTGGPSRALLVDAAVPRSRRGGKFVRKPSRTHLFFPPPTEPQHAHQTGVARGGATCSRCVPAIMAETSWAVQSHLAHTRLCAAPILSRFMTDCSPVIVSIIDMAWMRGVAIPSRGREDLRPSRAHFPDDTASLPCLGP